MRSIELFYVIFNIVLLGWLVFGRNKSQRGILIAGGMSMLFLLVHGIIEGMRWQMIPTYLMTLFFLVVVVIRHFFNPKVQKEQQSSMRRLRVVLNSTLAVLYSAIAVSLPIVLGIYL